MKIKLSKKQWETMGKKAGWIQAQEQEMSDNDLHRECIVAFKDVIKDMYPGDMRKNLPKLDWLIQQLEKKINITENEPSHDSPAGNEMVTSFDDDSIVPNPR